MKPEFIRLAPPLYTADDEVCMCYTLIALSIQSHLISFLTRLITKLWPQVADCLIMPFVVYNINSAFLFNIFLHFYNRCYNIDVLFSVHRVLHGYWLLGTW